MSNNFYGWIGASINDTDPAVNEQWAPKGKENDADADYIILKEKKNDEYSGTIYRIVQGRTNLDKGWLELDLLKKYYSPWKDPYRSQKKWAKDFGFIWKDNIDG